MIKFFSLLLFICISSLIPVFAYVEHYGHGGTIISTGYGSRAHYRNHVPPPPPPMHNHYMRMHRPMNVVHYNNFQDGYNPEKYCKFRVTYNESYCRGYIGYPYASTIQYVSY